MLPVLAPSCPFFLPLSQPWQRFAKKYSSRAISIRQKKQKMLRKDFSPFFFLFPTFANKNRVLSTYDNRRAESSRELDSYWSFWADGRLVNGGKSAVLRLFFITFGYFVEGGGQSWILDQLLPTYDSVSRQQRCRFRSYDVEIWSNLTIPRTT